MTLIEDTQRVLEKVKTFERNCQGATIPLAQVPALVEFPFPPYGSFTIHAPSARSGYVYTNIDLDSISRSFEQWLDETNAEYAPTDDDARYNVLCPRCGRVQIGFALYMSQMSLPDYPWVCPQCGEVSAFDSDSWEQNDEQ
jgi:predicted RNA-binding Zn-ribbon protein involved in translation (DUF1610 family)